MFVLYKITEHVIGRVVSHGAGESVSVNQRVSAPEQPENYFKFNFSCKFVSHWKIDQFPSNTDYHYFQCVNIFGARIFNLLCILIGSDYFGCRNPG